MGTKNPRRKLYVTPLKEDGSIDMFEGSDGKMYPKLYFIYRKLQERQLGKLFIRINDKYEHFNEALPHPIPVKTLEEEGVMMSFAEAEAFHKANKPYSEILEF